MWQLAHGRTFAELWIYRCTIITTFGRRVWDRERDMIGYKGYMQAKMMLF
jgi:hypothetical protein